MIYGAFSGRIHGVAEFNSKIMKILKSLTIGVAVVIAFMLLATGDTFAAGTGYSPYSPYGGHPPTDTALGGLTDLLVVAGLVTYIAGLSVIVYASKVKAIINSK